MSTRLGKWGLTIALVQACAAGLLCSESWAWQTNVKGTANDNDEARAVAVDSAGNVVAAGFTKNAGTGQDFTVIKFSRLNGAELWRRAINGTANDGDAAFAVAVDAADDVVAVGTAGRTGLDRDFFVVKLSGADGAERWRRTINGSDNRDDMALAVAVDAGGNVVAAGLITNTGTDADFAVVKLDGASGAELWRKTIDGSALFSADAAFAVTVDAGGNVLAAGRIQNAGVGWDFTVVKFAGVDGAELWRRVIDGTGHDRDEAFAVAVDSAGDVVAAGGIINEAFVEFTVIKFAGATGTEQWRQMIPGPSGHPDFSTFPSEARAVRVNGAGDVVAAGGTELGLPIYKFSGVDGTVLWSKLIANASSRALALDARGDVVSAGFSLVNIYDFNVIKFAGADGAVLWRRDIDGTTPNSADFASAITVDSSGNVAVAGVTRNPFDDFTVVKLRGLDGAVSTSVTRADFNADLRSDILWRNAATGENYVYPMNGKTIFGTEGYLRTVADLNWKVAGIGDFDGDGKADVLWRNSSTGENYLYFMDGTTIKPTEGYLRTVADQNWLVAGVGDFNGDGKDDILWRNQLTGENYIYFMNGLSIQPNEGYLRTVADLSWRIVGVADFDGDGKSDILWRNAVSGQNYLYPMNGTAIMPNEGFIRTVVDPAWQVKGVGDLDGDGKADIVWRNSSSGQNYLYPMDGATIKPTEGYLRTVADLNWQIAAVGDYDGDGKSDLLWRNSSTGQNYLYPMNGTTILPTEGYLRTVADQHWQVQNPR